MIAEYDPHEGARLGYEVGIAEIRRRKIASGEIKPYPEEEKVDGYSAFLAARSNDGADYGPEPVDMPDSMFDFQRYMTEWAIRKGRAAIFADCGLGKTLQELVWCDNIARVTDRPVLLLTPLAVAQQIEREGEKFGIEAARSRDGAINGRIVISNYERLHLFNSADFAGVACDESSILKSFDGARKGQITDFMRKTPYRLLATATAAPNDYVELGTSSEALGYLGHQDMLNRFFKNDQNNSATKRMYGEAPKWRFRGHGETPFWRWVTSWARACRKPSDLGFSDDRFMLPRLIERVNMVDIAEAPDGMLFTMSAVNIFEQRKERVRTIEDRCERAASLVDHDQPAVVWCHANAEGDLLERLIPGSVQVSGKDSDDAKEDKFEAFGRGAARVMITKPRIGAWGLNWQHAAHVVYFPSHSYESYYQAVRRCWRFGQTRDVVVDIVMTEGERKVMENLSSKSDKAGKMFENLVNEMTNATAIDRRTEFTQSEEFPSWL